MLFGTYNIDKSSFEHYNHEKLSYRIFKMNSNILRDFVNIQYTQRRKSSVEQQINTG
jgi:hypothetical protein